MDALNPVPRAGVVSRRMQEHFVTASSSNQTYSHITASGSSRVHNGNNYYITYDCSTGHGSLPMLLADQQAAIEQVSRPLQKRKRHASDVAETKCDIRERQTLATALESLGQYSNSIEQQSEGEHSREIAAQLMLILQSLEQAASHGRMIESFDQHVQDLKHQLRRARRMKINAHTPQSQASRVYKANSKATRITSGLWEISLTIKTLYSRSTDGQLLTETCSALRVERARGSPGPCIAALFSESIDDDRTVTMHPIVMAYNQVKADSRVFKLVENDDLVGLMQHLALGKASIRDCDDEGRSLIHYACYYASEDTCKFLVDSGCDLDGTAPSFEWDGTRDTPLSNAGDFSDCNINSFERFMKCRKHLLQAGADPTLGPVGTDGNAISGSSIMEALEETPGGRRITDPFEQILREGCAFFDVRSFHEEGESMWMHACSKAGLLSSPKILEILVQAGVTIEEDDDKGWNCLFKCVGGAKASWASNEFEALRFLLTIFEDIFARDSKGRTIFDVAANDETSRYDFRGSYRQDLWYCALFRSGLTRGLNIPLPPGRLVFDRCYRVENYRALLYLDTWDTERVRLRVPNYSLVGKDALSEEDKEAAPGLREWNMSDLLMMEKRIGRAIDFCENDVNHRSGLCATEYASYDSSEEWETEPEEDGTD